MKEKGVNKDLQNNTTKVSLAEINRPQLKENKKQKDYLQYVVDELVNDTIVDVRDQKIWHPYDSHYSRHLIGGAPGGFVDFVEDKFGVLRREVDLVWSHYKNKIKDENGWVQIVPFDDTLDAIRFAMSESRKYNKGNEEFKKIDNPKQHKFYNSIADKVVSLIEVRDSDRVGKIIYLTDLLDPQYPGQGAPLIDPINIPDYEAFQKRMMPIIHDFFPMLEKYWFIEDFFAQIFILTRFVFPKIWNKFYKGEDQPEESTEYGEHALDYNEKMGKEKITGGSNTSWDDVANNESIEPINESPRKQQKFLDTVLRDMINQSTISKSEFGIYNLVLPSGNHIFNFDLWETHGDDPPQYAINYMRDIYGMIEEEINQVWLRYKDIMLDRIKKLDDDNNPFSINESTKPLPDSVFQIIQDDLFERTVKIPRTNKPLCTGGENLNDYRVNDEENNAIFPFDKPNFIIQINLPSSPYPYNVEMGRGRSWGQLNDYLTQQYGLTHEECEMVWDEYRGTICKNAKLPISESEDDKIVFTTDKKKEKQQKVLDYALQDLTDNTLLDWGSNPNDIYQIIQFPFSVYPKEGSTRLEWIMIDKHYNLDIAGFYKQFKPYAQLMLDYAKLLHISLIDSKLCKNTQKYIQHQLEMCSPLPVTMKERASEGERAVSAHSLPSPLFRTMASSAGRHKPGVLPKHQQCC